MSVYVCVCVMKENITSAAATATFVVFVVVNEAVR